MNLLFPQSLFLLSIEGSLTLLILALFFLDLFAPKLEKKVLSGVALIGMLAILLEIPFLWNKSGSLFHGAYLSDKFAVFFEGLFLASGFFIIQICREFQARRKMESNAFIILMLIAISGASFLVSANNFLTLFISIELMTISLYILTAFLKSDARSIEAGVKYLIMGAFSSAVMLYGICFIYGTTGSLSFGGVRQALETMPGLNSLFLFGFFLLIAGLGFKISAFPFQLWVPDVYEGTPLPVTAFLSVISKGAGFAALLRILFMVTGKLTDLWIPLVALLSCSTLLYGNLGALHQLRGSVKRLLGFSSIGHAGYLLMGLASGNSFGMHAMIYYLTVYAVATLTIFLVVACASGEDESIPALAGLFSRSPILGVSFFIALLSLAGVPPLAGFFGKFLVIQAIVEKGLFWLAFVGAAGIVVSLYYYLMVIRTIYIEKKDGPPIFVSTSARAFLVCLTLALILLGVFQNPLLNLIQQTT